MKATFIFSEDDGDVETIVCGTGDFIKAERKFSTTTEQVLGSGSIEQWAFIVHSRLSHLVKRGGDTPGNRTSVKPFEDWFPDVEVEMSDVTSLADRLGNSEGAA